MTWNSQRLYILIYNITGLFNWHAELNLIAVLSDVVNKNLKTHVHAYIIN